MYKRGQVTIFLIVGIVILALFAGIFYFTSYVHQTQLEDESTAHPLAAKVRPQITSLVESCIKETAVPGIYLLGIQGGIIYPDDPATLLLTENTVINYGYLNGINQLDLEKMEEQLNRYIAETLPLCLEDFLIFAEEGILVEEKGEIKVDAKIALDEVIVTLKYKLDVTTEDDTVNIDSFTATVPVRVGTAVQKANQIIDQHIRNPATIALTSTAEEYFLSVFPFDSSRFIYSLNDQNSVQQGAPFTFMFALRDENINSPPELAYIPNMVVQPGSPLLYQLTAEDPEEDILAFSSDNTLFPVTSDGTINQVLPSAGTYLITFTVTDIPGLTDSQQVRIMVK